MSKPLKKTYFCKLGYKAKNSSNIFNFSDLDKFVNVISKLEISQNIYFI